MEVDDEAGSVVHSSSDSSSSSTEEEDFAAVGNNADDVEETENNRMVYRFENQDGAAEDAASDADKNDRDSEMEDPDETASEPEDDDDDANDLDGQADENSGESESDRASSPAKSDYSGTAASSAAPAPATSFTSSSPVLQLASSSSSPPTTTNRPKIRIKLKLPVQRKPTTSTTATANDSTNGSSVINKKRPMEGMDSIRNDDDDDDDDEDNDDEDIHATVVVADTNDADAVVDAVAVPETKVAATGAAAAASPTNKKSTTKKAMIPLSSSIIMKRPNSDKISGGKKQERPRLSNLFRKSLPITAASRASTITATTMGDGEDTSTHSTSLIVQQQQQRSRGTISALSTTHTGTSAASRSYSSSNNIINNNKQVRLPPIASPGLLLPSSGQGPRQAAAAAAAVAAEIGDENGYISSQQLFRITMASAGYTYEQRSLQPHRGSSVERTVGDLFDTPVHLATASKPVQLIEPELWNATIRMPLPPPPAVHQPAAAAAEETHAAASESPVNGEQQQEVRLTDLLLQNIQQSMRRRDGKRPRRSYSCTPFAAMVPVSLTIPYPDDYIQRQLHYLHEVETREAAIVAWQKEQEKIEIQMEKREWSALHNPDDTEDENRDKELVLTNPVTIPPIPEPPTPPQWHELGATPTIMTMLEEEGDSLQITKRRHQRRYFYHHLDDPDHNRSPDFAHPICIAKGQEKLVAHLDKNCFHVTQGRYFALQSSHTADPNFCGANAPGIAGVTTGGGLATATTSTTTSTSGLSGGGMTMILSSSFHSAAAVPANRDGQQQQEITTSSRKDRETVEKSKIKVEREEKSGSGKQAKAMDTIVKEAKTAAEKPKSSSATAESSKSAVTSTKMSNKKSKTTSDLRKKMDVSLTDAAVVKAFRDRIISAAVTASRKSKHLSHFKGPDGEVYPDVAKAFAAYSGLKPCERCKNNKQGTYHCRLRRRHMEHDFDGGDSIEILKPFLNDDELSQNQGTPLAKGVSNPPSSPPATSKEGAPTPEATPASTGAAASS